MGKLRRDIPLVFKGPYSFVARADPLEDDERWVFNYGREERWTKKKEFKSYPGIYIWALRSSDDNQRYVHYVGETGSFLKRQREHLINILGLKYDILDPEKIRKGIPKDYTGETHKNDDDSKYIWKGLFAKDGGAHYSRTAEQLKKYEIFNKKILEYLSMIEIFFHDDRKRYLNAGDRKGVESVIGNHVKSCQKDAYFYPYDCRLCRRPDNWRKTSVNISFANGSINIKGLDAQIPI